MSKEARPPKRLKIKRFSSIDGVREGKRLKSGLYQVGKNLGESERDLLVSPQFRHCVDVLSDRPEPEPLASDAELPQPEAGDVYRQQKRHEAEKAREELWNPERFKLQQVPKIGDIK